MELPDSLELTVSEFVALLNQTLDYAYPNLMITGELANLRVSKNRWVYFDLKDDESTVKFFGTVYQLPGPLEDGMLLKVRGTPRLHNLYGFSVNVSSIQAAGEGTIRRAAELLQRKLAKEGLFDESRKRPLPYPPRRIGLIVSRQSAAYADFIKILNARWSGIQIEHIDVQVQGEIAPVQIVGALEQFNEQANPPDVLVLIRGGGSAEDLVAFRSEIVTRAVAASRVPTLAAIGHEIDLSLAELAADLRASTPSNAAELLVPDRAEVIAALGLLRDQLHQSAERRIQAAGQSLKTRTADLDDNLATILNQALSDIKNQRSLLEAFNPDAVLRRGYAIVRSQGRAVRSTSSLQIGGIVDVQLSGGSFGATVDTISGDKPTNGKS